MNALEVEKMSEGIEGIVGGRTLNHEWYDIRYRDIQEVSDEQEA